jgi:hypothetical protein
VAYEVYVIVIIPKFGLVCPCQMQRVLSFDGIFVLFVLAFACQGCGRGL